MINRMATTGLAIMLLSASALRAAVDPATIADIDEAFRLAGVRTALDALPAHVNEMTVAAVAQLPRDKRKDFEPMIREVSRKFLDPNSAYLQLRTYFARHYDAKNMATFLALERTPSYRTMHRMEAAAETPAGQAGRRRFDVGLQSDPPTVPRVELLRRLDDATKTTDLEVRIAIAIMNAMSAALGAQMPADLDLQSSAFADKIRPILADRILGRYLYTFRNADDSDLEDYVATAQQPAIDWFNRSLQSGMLALATDRATRAGEVIKTKVSAPMN